jgi:O-acetyl-ADP-ribose deacetylase (regulator of RNase III)
MKSGIAKSIREIYPKAFTDYHNLYVYQGNELVLGEVIPSLQPDGRTVFNMITQEYYGRDPNVVYVSYEAVEYCIKSINIYVACKGIVDVGFPQFGAGLANGDWNKIAAIIEKTAEFQPIVYVYE